MKLFLMRFSYIGNVVSAQLINKETPPKLQAQSYTAISAVCPIIGLSYILFFAATPPYSCGFYLKTAYKIKLHIMIAISQLHS